MRIKTLILIAAPFVAAFFSLFIDGYTISPLYVLRALKSGLGWADSQARLLAVVPQEHAPPFPYTVLEAVLMGRAPYVGPYASFSREDQQKALHALDAVGISALADRPYTGISGGERQLTLIARALTQETPILLLDEPTSHLDFRNQHKVLEMVGRISSREGLTVLMTLHDPNLAACFAHRVVLLKAGEMMAEGTPAEVLTERHLERLYDIGIGIASDTERRFIYPKSAFVVPEAFNTVPEG